MSMDLGEDARTKQGYLLGDSGEAGFSGSFGVKVNRISRWMRNGVCERAEPNMF